MSGGKEDGAIKWWYKWYVLGVVSAGYIMGELAHFITGTTSKAMAQDMHYGDTGCMLNVSTGFSVSQLPVVCETVNSTDRCLKLSVNGTNYCEWGYNGLGMDYQILAGPAFMAIYTIGGVVIGIIADKFNRSIILGICTFIFSAALLLMGACTKYWHLVILRMIIAAGESGCNPLASGILTDMFPEDQLALALSIYNWGIFVGFGISFPVGRYVTDANIWGLGWRMCYYLSGGGSMLVALLTFFTLKEPKRIAIGLEKEAIENRGVEETNDKFAHEQGPGAAVPDNDQPSTSGGAAAGLRRPSALVREYPGGVGSAVSLEPIKVPETRTSVFRIMIQPRMILLCIVATMRNSGGNSFAYNTDLFYRKYYPASDLSWALFFISVVVGSFGVLAGGIISDKFVTRMGVRSRLLVLSVSQLIASPFAFGSVTFEPTWAMLSLAVSYFFAEMWLGNFYAVLVEIVPLSVRSTAVGVFLFIMNNISGNLPIAIDPVSKIIGYREALWIFYAGFYFGSSILFFVTMFMMPKPLKTKEVEPESKELMDFYSNKPNSDVKS